jgi:hypothetical protein
MYSAIRFAASSTDEQRSRVRVAPRVFLDTRDGAVDPSSATKAG